MVSLTSRLLTLTVAFFTAGGIAFADANSATWNDLIDAMVQSGTAMDTPVGTYLTLKSIQPDDVSREHIANYISVVGGYDSRHEFGFNRVEAVWEHWTIDTNGNWDVDQWLFRLTPDGDLVSASHYNLVEDMRGVVKKHEAYSETKEVLAARWEKLKAGWLKHISR